MKTALCGPLLPLCPRCGGSCDGAFVGRRRAFHRFWDRQLEPSLVTLLKWAARDNDRTMLFAAELHIVVE